MKKNVLVTLILVTLLMFSCENNLDTQENLGKQTIDNSNISSKKKLVFIYADWDGWGRTSKECSGFGLCRFESCTFCCIENEIIVPCGQSNQKSTSGIIVLDEETNEGYLEIKLDPSDSIQANAINNKEILYIDSDLMDTKYKLYQGNYNYDSTIGLYGGYHVRASLK